MLQSDRSAVSEGPRRRSKHEYTLLFRASGQGVAKRVELEAGSADSAVDLALADRARRTVDIWQDGEFLCRVSRDEHSRPPHEAKRNV